MEWVETTGRTVAEAKDAALDELGVDEADAEFEVLAEPQHGLFGRLRSEARVRARVKPTAPRAKEDRRGRDRRRRAEGGAARSGPSSTQGGTSEPSVAGAAAADAPAPGAPAAAAAGAAAAGAGTGGDSGVETGSDDEPSSESAPSGSNGGGSPGSEARKKRRRRGGHRPGETPSGAERAKAERSAPGIGDHDEWDDENQTKGTAVEVDLDHQAEVAVDFLTKLVAEFGVEATVAVVNPDPDTVEIQLSGSELGILIGPKGQTLVAVQNLTRTAVFNETGGSNGHINVDISGYRQKRSEALVRFAQQAADHVKSSGQRTALEPMSSIDRKIVHDTIAGIEGVSTVSEGEEPRRRVVVLPG